MFDGGSVAPVVCEMKGGDDVKEIKIASGTPDPLGDSCVAA